LKTCYEKKAGDSCGVTSGRYSSYSSNQFAAKKKRKGRGKHSSWLAYARPLVNREKGVRYTGGGSGNLPL